MIAYPFLEDGVQAVYHLPSRESDGDLDHDSAQLVKWADARLSMKCCPRSLGQRRSGKPVPRVHDGIRLCARIVSNAPRVYDMKLSSRAAADRGALGKFLHVTMVRSKSTRVALFGTSNGEFN